MLKIPTSYLDRRIGFKIPQKLSEDLAEIVGMLYVDGHMARHQKDYISEIVGHLNLDYDYLTGHVSLLFYKLFNILPSTYLKKNNAISIRFRSKALNYYLESLGIPPRKKGNLEIPAWILADDQFMRSFIRGLIDTDGSLVLLNRKQKKHLFYPRISLALNDKDVIAGVAGWLDDKGLNVCTMKDNRKYIYKNETRWPTGYRLNVNGRKQLEKWMDLIGFRNKKHLDKYIKYKSGLAGTSKS